MHGSLIALICIYAGITFMLFVWNCMDYNYPVDAEEKKSGARGMFLAPAWPVLFLAVLIRAIIRMFKGMKGWVKTAEFETYFSDWKSK